MLLLSHNIPLIVPLLNSRECIRVTCFTDSHRKLDVKMIGTHGDKVKVAVTFPPLTCTSPVNHTLSYWKSSSNVVVIHLGTRTHYFLELVPHELHEFLLNLRCEAIEHSLRGSLFTKSTSTVITIAFISKGFC